VLEMDTSIFMCLSIKLVGLHHIDESWPELEWVVPSVDRWFGTDVGRTWSKEFMEGLVSHGLKDWC
jgi:hypothetical protein